ncbi:type I-A CRISPR-associated protein Csa5 [Candidatus Aerophobetes bacterium]|nr:type I-A CRISPR-associated protein Csa5 [Candidatus Aerophobetes bacterium]
MSEKIILYTPATGFPDLEAKIAYGLARVGIEAFECEKVRIKPFAGYYAVEMEGDMKILNDVFKLLCNRLLQSEYIFLNTPGIKRSGKQGEKGWNLLAREDEKHQLDKYLKFSFSMKNEAGEPVCNHEGSKIGVQIGFSAGTSYHQSRDKIDTQKDKRGLHRPTSPKKLCKTCGLLATLGMWFASFIFNIKEKEVMVIPIPEDVITGADLERIFSVQHHLRRDFLPADIPSTLIPLVFLSKIPSTTEMFRDFKLFIALLVRQAQVYHIDSISLIAISDYLKFLENPYNTASVDRMLQKEAFGALQELNKVIYYKNLSLLLSFPRLYVQETSTDNFVNLLYPETSRYFLKEVAMIKPEIIENEAIGSVARTLRYFIRDKKYHYADDIRNARKDSKDFEETIVKMLREAELRRVQEEEKKKAGKEHKFVNIPNEKEIKELFQLANKNFDEVKTALVIIAFSFPTKGKEELEIKEEVQNA